MKPEAAGELLSCKLTAPAWQHGSVCTSERVWHSALKEVQVACSLDAAFGGLQFSIQQRLPLLRRDLQARVRLWLAKMAVPTRNLTFKQMRNDHAAVLLVQLSQGQLLQPFDGSPPPGPLQQLPRSMLPRSRSPGRKSPRWVCISADAGRRRYRFNGTWHISSMQMWSPEVDRHRSPSTQSGSACHQCDVLNRLALGGMHAAEAQSAGSMRAMLGSCCSILAGA